MLLSALGEAVVCELKRDAHFDNRQPCLDQDDDVTNVRPERHRPMGPLASASGPLRPRHEDL